MFRPFNMNTMDNVSILFADIVGFTRLPTCSSQSKFKHNGHDCHRMSSNKTASQLVGLLNDLFGRWWRSSILFAHVHFSCCGVHTSSSSLPLSLSSQSLWSLSSSTQTSSSWWSGLTECVSRAIARRSPPSAIAITVSPAVLSHGNRDDHHEIMTGKMMMIGMPQKNHNEYRYHGRNGHTLLW